MRRKLSRLRFPHSLSTCGRRRIWRKTWVRPPRFRSERWLAALKSRTAFWRRARDAEWEVTYGPLEEADKGTNFKDFMTNVLTQAGVVSALLLSIEIPMVQLPVPEGFVRGTVCWDVYYGTCFLSTGFSVQGVCISVLALGYIQGLDRAECLNFLARSPDAIGFAISTMATAAYLLIIQTTMYFVITTSSYYMVIYIGIAALICIYNITTGWRAFSTFENQKITKDERRARKRLLGLEHERSWMDWLSSIKSKPQNAVEASAVGFNDRDTPNNEHGKESFS